MLYSCSGSRSSSELVGEEKKVPGIVCRVGTGEVLIDPGWLNVSIGDYQSVDLTVRGTVYLER